MKFQMTLYFHNALTSFFELTMACNNHTCKVRDASDNFPQTPTLPMLPFLGHMGGGYLVVYLMREEDPTTLPPLGHMEGGYIYVAVSIMREGDSTNIPLQAITTQGLP